MDAITLKAEYADFRKAGYGIVHSLLILAELHTTTIAKIEESMGMRGSK